MKFLAPAEGDFDVVCEAPLAERWARFARTLDRRGRARLELDAAIRVEALPVASFRGQYVALAGPPA